ncbi:MAG: hypothetical protein LUD50_05510 [Clostridia bacterium]|nr:hypothetical protein [Clostridia bacterium]
MAKGKKRHFLNGRTLEPFAESACVPYGFFKNDPIEEVGFSDEIVEILKHYLGISSVWSIMNYSSAQLRRSWSLRNYVSEVIDTVDDYIYEAIEKRKKEYYDDPVPVYKLLEVKDISRYGNYLLYDFNRKVLHFVPEVFAPLRANGIITLQDFLKMNLVVYHEYAECNDKQVRTILSEVKKGLRSISKVPSLAFPLDSPGKDVIIYPLPEDARERVSSLTDDRIAGDKVSLKGMTSYEKALYNRSKDAIDDCGEDFYYDVLDGKEVFEGLAKGLAMFCSPEIELLERKSMIRSLYLSVPEKLRQMPARALCHYMRPRYTNTGNDWPYRDWCGIRQVVFFNGWDAFRTSDRMVSLEKAFMHMEELMDSCSTVDELDKLIETDNDVQFIDLLDWLSHATMLNAIYDSFMKPHRQRSHEATKQMKQRITETDPDEVIARFNELKKMSFDMPPADFPYYDDNDNSFWDTCRGCRYDFFSVYMLLTGKTSVPGDIVDGFLYGDDADDLKRYVLQDRYAVLLYGYNPETGMVTINDDALQQ